jgi:hypothetical protein
VACQRFLKKLGEEGKALALTYRALKFLMMFQHDEATKDVPWNRQEVRIVSSKPLLSQKCEENDDNIALQTAVALAATTQN